jgi:hypothetical protein
MRIRTLCSLFALLFTELGVFQPDSFARDLRSDADQQMQIPIADEAGHQRMMRGHICRPEGIAKPRLVVINHGSPPNPRERPRMPLLSCDSEAAQWFLHRQYAVVIVLRLGYGASDGPWAEGYGGCDDADFYQAGLETAREINAIVDYAITLRDVDTSDVVVVGQSAGGWGTVAFNSIAHPHVSAFINMAGGRGGHYRDRPNSNCHPEKLVEAVAKYGNTATTPMLWVYVKNDSFFNPKLARVMYEYFSQTGGKAEFLTPESFDGDGHHLFAGRGGSSIWGPAVEKYLNQVGSTRAP